MFMLDPDVHKPVDNKLKAITVIERDGLDVRALTILLRVLSDDPDFDLKQAVRDACTQYVLTEDGKAVYSYNCGCFNWADFETNVPNDICRQHGFEKVDYGLLSDEDADWDEQLVDESRLPDGKEEE